MNMNQPIDLKNLFETLKTRIQQEAQKRKPKSSADPDHYGLNLKSQKPPQLRSQTLKNLVLIG